MLPVRGPGDGADPAILGFALLGQGARRLGAGFLRQQHVAVLERHAPATVRGTFTEAGRGQQVFPADGRDTIGIGGGFGCLAGLRSRQAAVGFQDPGGRVVLELKSTVVERDDPRVGRFRRRGLGRRQRRKSLGDRRRVESRTRLAGRAHHAFPGRGRAALREDEEFAVVGPAQVLESGRGGFPVPGVILLLPVGDLRRGGEGQQRQAQQGEAKGHAP